MINLCNFKIDKHVYQTCKSKKLSFKITAFSDGVCEDHDQASNPKLWIVPQAPHEEPKKRTQTSFMKVDDQRILMLVSFLDLKRENLEKTFFLVL